MKNHRGLTQVFWGNGKGKTTAAMGTALRALGHGHKVHLVQFMKSGSESFSGFSGELLSLIKFDNFSFKKFGSGSWVVEKTKSAAQMEAEKALSHILAAYTEDYDIIVADEILYALQFSLIEESQVINLIRQKPIDKELILTGSHKPFPNVFELADLVTEVRKDKHPFDKGIKARKGIEY